MKKIIYIWLIFCMLIFTARFSEEIISSVLFLFLVITSDDSAEKNDVFRFVCENEETLLDAIENRDFSSFENKGFINDVKIDGMIIDFSCGGAGVGSGTFYVGFYYAPNDDMAAVWCAPASSELLLPSGNGFEWRESNGDDRYYIENICNDFYYYEASF